MFIFNIKSNLKGAISVYLCIMFGIMVSVLLVMIESTRVNAMRLMIECTTDMATDSLLSEYHKVLLERYGLLFIDDAYEMDNGSLDNMADHLTSFMEYNLSPDKDLITSKDVRDFYGLSACSVDFLKVSRATDNDGQVFRHMAISYMLDKYGLSYIDAAKDLIKTTENYKLDEGNIIEDNLAAQDEIDKIDTTNLASLDIGDVDLSNPTANVRLATGKGILSLVCKGDISSTALDLSTLASHRDNVSGDGLFDKWPDYDGIQYDLLFNEYILDKLGNYVEPKDNSNLQYQVEYVLFGSYNDMDNLKQTAERILMIRGAANTLYYLSDSGLQNEVKTLALGLAIITLMPHLLKIYQLAISLAYIFAESLHDVSILLKGGKVPLIKEKGDWFFKLENALNALAGTFSDDIDDNDTGQDYKDYLRIILYLTGNKDKVLRSMDVIESDVRHITGKPNFRLDNCIGAGEVQIIFESTYGYSFLTKRCFCYW